MSLADTDLTLRPSHNRVAFRTIGCKLNQCETAQMQEALAAEGYLLVDWDMPADVRVINTCTVTSRSDKTCRNEIRHAKRLDPDCVVAVTGCYAQVDAEAIASIPGVDLVLGNLDKRDLAATWDRLRHRAEMTSAPRPATAAPSTGRCSDPPSSRYRPMSIAPVSRATVSLTSTAIPGPSSRSRMGATHAAPTASSRWRAARRAACRSTRYSPKWTCWPPAAIARSSSPASTSAVGAATPARGRSPTCFALSYAATGPNGTVSAPSSPWRRMQRSRKSSSRQGAVSLTISICRSRAGRIPCSGA